MLPQPAGVYRAGLWWVGVGEEGKLSGRTSPCGFPTFNMYLNVKQSSGPPSYHFAGFSKKILQQVILCNLLTSCWLGQVHACALACFCTVHYILTIWDGYNICISSSNIIIKYQISNIEYYYGMVSPINSYKLSRIKFLCVHWESIYQLNFVFNDKEIEQNKQCSHSCHLLYIFQSGQILDKCKLRTILVSAAAFLRGLTLFVMGWWHR